MARLIDTTVLIDMERRRRRLSVLQDLTVGETIAISSVSAAELLLGIERTDSIERRQRREQFAAAVFLEIPVLSFDLRVARVYARTAAFLLDTGQPIARHDLTDVGSRQLPCALRFVLPHGGSIEVARLVPFGRFT